MVSTQGGLAMTLEELKQGIVERVPEVVHNYADAGLVADGILTYLAESGACFVVQENAVVWNVISLKSMLEAEKK
jgi:hypothetical protein